MKTKSFFTGAIVGAGVTALGFWGTKEGWFGKVAKFAKNLVTVTKNQTEDVSPEEATPAKQTA